MHAESPLAMRDTQARETMGSNACRICASTASDERFVAREMMFGMRDTFEYVRCSACGCLQIAEIPDDLSRYYPPHYYSFGRSPITRPRRAILRALRAARDRYALTGHGAVGRWLYSRFPYPELQSLSRVPGLSRASRILDVGSGSGVLLSTLWGHGFRNVLGIDPHMKDEPPRGNEPPLLRQTLEQTEGEWDVVMFHHSFEHVADPAHTLESVANRLAPGGCCLIRVPVVPSTAWEEFRADWVGLDAPRHLFIPTVESLRLLAARAGLGIREVVYDSTEFQFWGSEQYRRDIPLRSERSYAEQPSRSLFSRSQIAAFRRRAAELNRLGRGDQAAFYLT